MSRSLEHALRERGVPYQIVNGLEFYQRKEIKDVLCYLRLILNPKDEEALIRVINYPAQDTPPARTGALDVLAQHVLGRACGEPSAHWPRYSAWPKASIAAMLRRS